MRTNSKMLPCAAAALALVAGCAIFATQVPAPTAVDAAGRLPANIPMPADNVSTPERVEPGKDLFLDLRLSGSGASQRRP